MMPYRCAELDEGFNRLYVDGLHHTLGALAECSHGGRVRLIMVELDDDSDSGYRQVWHWEHP